MTMIERNPDIAFTRNPIRFADSEPSESTRTFTMKVGGEAVYTGRYTAPAVIDIAEIAEAYVDPIPSPEGAAADESGILLTIEDPEAFGRRLVSVKDESDEALMTEFYALPGGVSPQNFRRLQSLGCDIFDARLLDRNRNFFLTTRTHGWRIVMDELEVFPLLFVSLQEEDVELAVRAVGTEFEVTVGTLMRGIYAIDIEAVRMKIAGEESFLASAFDILCDGVTACRIVIRHTLPERETTLVRFRNSLGAMEQIHLSGTRITTVSREEDGRAGKRYDPATGRYARISARRTAGYVIEAQTGYKDNDEMGFVLDMAASEETYVQTPSGWTRAIPSIDKMQLKDPQKEPTSVKVTFTLVEGEDNRTPGIIGLDDFKRPRIFSDRHSDQFN